ncbi:hypothetical protein MRB53_023593 [Persea americana]|uniref:Uncharacterized protein n=1 Tax=Persea americana TaxID=3435 RepID=A0ACC2LA12_PERAE|nr:hypothetical protein MRB53_023593 [Persea americana]
MGHISSLVQSIERAREFLRKKQKKHALLTKQNVGHVASFHPIQFQATVTSLHLTCGSRARGNLAVLNSGSTPGRTRLSSLPISSSLSLPLPSQFSNVKTIAISSIVARYRSRGRRRPRSSVTAITAAFRGSGFR